MTASYIYAFVRPGECKINQSGIDGNPVRLVANDDVAAVVSSVDESLFDPETLEARVDDLNWIATLAQAHDEVVSAAAAQTTTLPLRLGTTCADDASVRSLLDDLASQAVDCLARLDGRAEWGVQLFAATRPPGRRDGAAHESGTDFLRRRRAELEQAEALRVEEEAKAAAAYEQLAALSAEAQRHPTRNQNGRSMVLNAAFLVDVSSADRFRQSVETLSDSYGSGRVALTGPWAPYSFAELSP